MLHIECNFDFSLVCIYRIMATKIVTTNKDPEFRSEMDLLDFMYKFFHLTFIAPMLKTTDNSWKKRLYNLVRQILLITYFPSFLGIVLGLYKFWGDMKTVTNMFVTGVPLIMGFCAGLYFYWYWKEIRDFMESIERESNFINPFVHSKTKLLQIVEDTKRKCKFITQFIAIFQFFAFVAFFIKPFILDFSEESELKIAEEEYRNEQWKRLIYIMWLPIDITSPEMYYYTYAYQLITSLALYCHTATTITFIFVSSRYAAAQFTIVCEALNDVSILNIFSVCRYEMNTGGRDLLNSQSMPEELHPNLRKSMDSCVNGLADKEIKSNEVHIYIRECIQIHQSAIRYAMKLNNLLSPVFVMYLSLLTIGLIMGTIQLAVVDELDQKFPYFGSVSVTLTDLFAFCWHGQILINESLSVEQAAYNMLWYNHCSSVKQLVRFIIFRAQKMTELKRSGFLNLSIRTFSAVLNFSYKWFTILLEMHDD
ncbi:Odorant receptor 17 [Blattella germanica]|nr:Odorant receptor 17 [Blattella germanica]